MTEGALSARINDAPNDPIFGIVELYRADTRPHKINLAAGVYMDERGVAMWNTVMKLIGRPSLT